MGEIVVSLLTPRLACFGNSNEDDHSFIPYLFVRVGYKDLLLMGEVETCVQEIHLSNGLSSSLRCRLPNLMQLTGALQCRRSDTCDHTIKTKRAQGNKMLVCVL